jgi:uncharacterized protein (DUF169 family)
MDLIGIAFVDAPPAGVPRVSSPGPASCAYWKRALAGEVFWTDATDHLGCPIGAHTHGAPMTPEKGKELEGIVGTMVGLEYLTMDDVPKIPHRAPGSLKVAVYAPFDRMPVPADVALARGTTARLMVVVEAAQSAGIAPDAPALGRPTCAVLPQAIGSKLPQVSLGCVGNRVYTGLGEGEGWVAIPAAAVPKLRERLAVLERANAELEKFHRARA